MTLVITRLTPFGIAMAADTAVTTESRDSQGKRIYCATPSATAKLFRIPGLQAGISCWGRGSINGTDTSAWLQRFLGDGGPFPSIKVLAHRLKSAMDREIGQQLTGESSIGFHVTGYEAEDAGPEPTFFHVHDGRSDIFPEANPRQINVHHDCKSEDLKKLFNQGRMQEMRNGEFRPYAVLRDALENAYQDLRSVGWPHVTFESLEDVAKYCVTEICLMSDIYALFGTPVIGGEVHFLAIPKTGEIAVQRRPNGTGAVAPVTFLDSTALDRQPTVSEHARSGSATRMAESFAPTTNHVAGGGSMRLKQ